MNKAKILLFLPVFVLLGWVISVQAMISEGTKMELPIRGYDPRDILAGHYLSVEVNFDDYPSECAVKEDQNKSLRWQKRDAFFCSSSGRIVLERTADCGAFIKGYCQYNRFHSNISRFYVPERASLVLERAVRNRDNDPMLLLSVAKNGQAYPLDLILQGKPFKEWLELRHGK
ncbi:MAG: GDYXXLXY domain-containing protein [Alphaproteobacteria bacterium]|nr:GDYXXLXY domain-containing protein [Alphaproteobacteria bacterium]